MKVPFKWLDQLVETSATNQEIVDLLPHKTIGTKEVTTDFVELDMKGYNRADLLSMRGVAYEIAAITNGKVTFSEPSEADFVWENRNLGEIKVDIQNADLCPFYCVARIEGLAVKDSPQADIKTLADAGMRSVNNIADITNLMMLEYGQPLHAFDADKVAESTIVVRNAKKQEMLTTLDKKDHQLTDQMLVIADAEKALGIAGVMGGANSEVTDSTTSILLEAAIFDPQNLRKTTNQLALASEASKRFYHGLTKKRLLQTLDAAIRAYEQRGGKLTGMTIVSQYEDQTIEINLRLNKINSLLGLNINNQQAETILNSLNFRFEKTNDGWIVTPPYWRKDCQFEVDLIEEIARIYGYSQIPATPLPGNQTPKIDQAIFTKVHDLKQQLVDIGLTEIQTYSFYSSSSINNLGFQTADLIKIANPISKETEYLRHQLWPNVFEKSIENRKYFDDIAIFEIGKTYQIAAGKPTEKIRLAIALSTNDDPIYELLEMIEQVYPEISVNPTNQESLTWHPTKQGQLLVEDREIGFIATIHPRIIDQYNSSVKVAVAEIELN